MEVTSLRSDDIETSFLSLILSLSPHRCIRQDEICGIAHIVRLFVYCKEVVLSVYFHIEIQGTVCRINSHFNRVGVYCPPAPVLTILCIIKSFQTFTVKITTIIIIKKFSLSYISISFPCISIYFFFVVVLFCNFKFVAVVFCFFNTF